jgi:hypothetical protein
MKREPELLRWSDPAERDVPRGMRSALDAARADGPSAEQLERLLARVAPGGAAPAGPAAGAGGVSAVLKGSSVIALLAIGYAAWIGLRAPEAPAVARPIAPQQAPVAAPAPAAPAPAPLAREPAAPTEERSTRAARAVHAPEPPPAPRGATDEIALLSRAKRAIAATPGRALALLDQHEREFPRGTFVEEREALAIEALHAAGRGDQARRKLAAFRERYPGSAYLRRLDGLLFTVSTRK